MFCVSVSNLAQLLSFTLIVFLLCFATPSMGQNITASGSNVTGPAAGSNTSASDSTASSPNSTTSSSSPNSTSSSSSNSTASSPKGNGKFRFDCRRNGASCQNGNCSLNNGSCSCPATGLHDYMCNPVTPSASGCPSCENGGTCVQTAGGPACDCTEAFYGSDCSLPRAEVLCGAGKMYVNINPIGPFIGDIYVLGQPTCKFSYHNNTGLISTYSTYLLKQDDYKDFQGYGLELQNNDPACGDAQNENSMLVRKIYIQYSTVYKSSVDEVVTVGCSASADNVTLYSDISSVNDYERNLNNINANGTSEPASLKVQTTDGTPAKTVNLGDNIYLVFTLNGGNNGYSDFRLIRCDANNTKPEPDYRSITFISNGCPTDEAKSLFSGVPVKSITNGNTVIKVGLTAFLFMGSSNVAFWCTLGFCPNSSGECATRPCPGFSSDSSTPVADAGDGTSNTPVAGGGNGTNNTPVADGGNSTSNTPVADAGNGTAPSQARKRRAAEQGSASAQITVRGLTTENTETQSKTEECINNPGITTIVAILAACVGLLFLLSVFLIVYLFILKKKKKETHTTGDHRYYSHVEPVRIPRLEMHSTQGAM